jgi:mannose-6-phosphate isomerase-like protein (cupin superfamily)
MKVGHRPVFAPPAPPQSTQAGAASSLEPKKKPDDLYAESGSSKVHALMDNTLRAEQAGGERPKPQMTAGAGVRAFADAKQTHSAAGVTVHALLDETPDPACRITRTDVAQGHATPEGRSDVDQRTLVEGQGTLVLNGVRQSVAPGDMVFLPKGTRFSFEADAGAPLKLWSVGSPGQGTAEPAPMTRPAGVLSEEPGKEFFVGEGVLILERANSAADPGVGFDRCRAPAGITTALHRLKIDERYVITRGEGTMQLGDEKVHVKAGDVVLIPKGVPQRITAGDGGVDFYSVTTPRFLVDDYDKHLEDAVVDPKKYDGLAGPLAAVEAKIHAS